MKKGLLLFFVVVLCGLQAVAQNFSVSGKVTYADDGSPVIGATVMVKGMPSVGSITDVNGVYKITIPASAAEKVLVCKYVGLENQEKAVASNGQVIDFLMEADVKNIETVVVTAQGITRSQRSVGYSTAVVNAEELTAAQSPSLMQGVSGKVAGINISQSGGAGTSQKVIIRGYASVNGNQPLYVVDGIPIDNNYAGTDPISALNNAVDFGNGANDINPNDVESMTILKGASATALYGSRAANGVILITTKKARGEKFSVTYDGSFMGQEVLRTPQTQDMFGQGWPYWSPGENGSWGPKYDGRMNLWGAWANNPKKAPAGWTVYEKPYSYVENNLRGFYKTGFEMTNNISVNMAKENMGLTISYGNVSSDGVLHNKADFFERNTLSVRGYLKHKRFSADAQINYVRKDANQAPAAQGGIYNDLLQYAGDIDYKAVRDLSDPHNNFGNYYTWYAQNPWQQIVDNKNTYQDDRVYGKVELGYDITDNIKAIARLGADFTNARQNRWRDRQTIAPNEWGYKHKKDEAGYYYTSANNYNQLDATVLVTANYKVADDKIGLGGFLGWNLNQRGSSYVQSELNSLSIPGWFNIDNSESAAITKERFVRRRLIGAMGQLDFSYTNGLFVSLSARNDWSSTLPIDKNSFFYWGANASFIFNEYIDMGDQVNMLKMRLAYGQTGNDANPYYTSTSYLPARFTIPFGYLNLPFGGTSGLIQNNVLGNDNLRPEITTEWEVGLSGGFFGNRLRFDVGYYDKVTKDQIIEAAMAPETGYTKMAMNVGQISNKGIEAMLGFTPVQSNDWKWDVNVTFSKNWSNVDKLWGEGVNEVKELNLSVVSGYWFGLVVGQPVGTFQSNDYKKVEDQNSPHYGKYIVPTTGGSAGTLVQDPSKKVVLGNSNPDYVIGFNTQLTWKGLSLMATLDYRQGGMMYSKTQDILNFSGNSVRSAYNERQPYIVPNTVVSDGKGGYIENYYPYMGNPGLGIAGPSNASSYDAAYDMSSYLDKGFIKLRELVVSYSFPSRLFGTGKVVKGLSLSLIGRNLFMWTLGNNQVIDPEVTNFGNDIRSEFGEFYAAPSLRTFGGSIKITF